MTVPLTNAWSPFIYNFQFNLQFVFAGTMSTKTWNWRVGIFFKIGVFLVITGCSNWFNMQGWPFVVFLPVVNVRLLVVCSRLFVACGRLWWFVVVCGGLGSFSVLLITFDVLFYSIADILQNQKKELSNKTIVCHWFLSALASLFMWR